MRRLQSSPPIDYLLHEPEGAARTLLLVHGSERDPAGMLAAFVPFAERHRLRLVAPLFPASLGEPGNEDGYKFLVEDGVSYLGLADTLLAEVGAGQGLLLFGFSGGAQFAHRYLLFNAARVSAAVIGAPGTVTLLDPALPWWTGIADAERVFGRPVDLEALRRTRLLLMVGEADRGSHQIVRRPGDRYWMQGADRAGPTRPDRLRALWRSLAENGVAAEIELVPGAGHALAPMLPATFAFFERALTSTNGGGSEP